MSDVTAADIRAAAARIAPFVARTPLIRNAALDGRAGARVFVKAECLQRTGSFKIRGASNKILTLGDAQRRNGVVAFSSGNHALAVSEAAATFGIAAVVVMPADAPRAKLEGARRRGAEVVTYDRQHEDREAICASIIQGRGMTLVPPFDDPAVIAGAGTVGLEAAEQAASELDGHEVDLALVCCSGGGLSAGFGLALRDLYPNAELAIVEPQGFDDTGRSLAGGEIVRNARLSGSICDALLAVAPGRLTYPILRALDAHGIRVSDDEVKRAMRFAFEELKLVVEPGGAAALAAVLSGAAAARGRNVLLVCSGGNVDPSVHATYLREAA